MFVVGPRCDESVLSASYFLSSFYGSGPRALSIASRLLAFARCFRNRTGGFSRFVSTPVFAQNARNKTDALLTCCLDFLLSRNTSGIGRPDCSRLVSSSGFRASFRKPDKERRSRPARFEHCLPTSGLRAKLPE